MASFINTNTASLNAQRNLTTSAAGLATSLQRLSSGLRINSAKDDAAGLAISERLTAQIRGSDQATRNANDGISLAQTAEGDLAQIGNNLQRIRELAVQSSNATNSASDRAALNNEAAALIAEIDRVASSSSFNGNKLLDGSFNAQTFQIGANNTANDRITVSNIASARANSLGVGSASSYSSSVVGANNTATALASGDLIINGYNVGASGGDGVSSVSADASGIAKAAAINAVSAQTKVTATVGATSVAGFTSTTGDALAANDILINGVDIGAIGTAGSAGERGSQITAAINAKTAQTGVTASFDTTTGAVALNAADGRNISITKSANAEADDTNTGLTTVSNGVAIGAAGTATSFSNITLNSADAAGIIVANGVNAGSTNAGLAPGLAVATATAGAGVSSLNLTTAAGAQSALSTIDAALTTINNSRASLGAYQARFSSVVTSLQTTSENLSASRSRIQDTDFAAETAALTRGQILQQAGTAMLAQANSLPNGVLALLRG
ncbi:flagellin N-terminal helical domain-containing protein [Massilia glaciei]|uniref:Flagellin n=1 Tax=Massilia glaciei TaxID=1524097 RepID=A0A2U2HF29_9BURK|nr:flagellin [Massilia glaciei]PWF42662.1 flagellin [Massilia glaciei]